MTFGIYIFQYPASYLILSIFSKDLQQFSPNYLCRITETWTLQTTVTIHPLSHAPLLLNALDSSLPTSCGEAVILSATPALHHLPEFAQTHVHWVNDAIQPSHPLSSPSPAFNLSQHQGLFQWVSSSHQVAKVLELQLQHQSFQRIFRTDFLYWLVESPCSPRDSQESSPTPQFKSINSWLSLNVSS